MSEASFQEDLERTLEAHRSESRRRYWKEKDLSGARAEIDAAIALADRAGRDDLAKPFLYDLASFCYPGWDEPGIVITPEDVVAGEAAAKRNLRLALALRRGPVGEGNAWFIVGGYHLAAGRCEDARECFARYEALAPARPAHAELARGLQALSDRNAGLDADVERHAVALETLGEDGVEFAAQLRTAARVFPIRSQT